jgi:hypothetical protein
MNIQLPKERKPILVEKNNCISLKNIKYIHDYSKFKKIIVDPFLQIIRKSARDKFINTCDYMFKNVGYGVFVFILNGKIHTYQLFANITTVKPGSKCITKKMISKNNRSTRKNKKGIPITNKKQMGFHYCMFKAYKGWWKSETDKSIYYHLLESCLQGTNITTCFFLNLNTFPVLFKRKCDQYILHQDVCKNNEQIDNTYIPVLSGASTKEHFDKCIVYPDTWEIITQKRFGAFCTNNFIDSIGKLNTKWDSKTDTLIFRGENKTCYQTDKNKNERIKVITILNNIERDHKTNIDIDVGLVNLKPKNFFINDKMNSDNIDFMKTIKSVEKIPMNEQSNCKYILDIDGHANPWRLCFELSYNSCIILMLSQYYSWFYDKLKHMKNVYIIDVNSKHLEKEIVNCLQKLERNDNIGKKLAKESTELYKEIMNKNYVKKYMTDLLSSKDFNIIEI